ncbi:M16 family metallopeptidase [Anaeromyxobacter oryzisoli]|uniref:M16 family metallopeptidase n=1 Tax=Anaeromyxobacter oryzisoli TaxID=2925408 RepID=UPI001F5AD028|nr:pitrilysin family protein [Anaeromyxobacter sp. SG63]
MTAPITLPPIHRETLPNGLRVIVAERKGVPLVAARLVIRGGASFDPAGRCGLAHLVALAARRGTRRRTGPEIDLAVESLGADLAAGVDEDATYVGLTAPVEALPRCLDILSDVTAGPTFPAREVERIRRREVASLAHDLDEPGVVADRAMLAAAFGDHPYGHAPEGSVKDLGAARRADVLAFHRRHYRPADAFVVVVGAVRAEEVLAQVRRRLGGWRGPAAPAPVIAPPAPPRAAVVVVDKPDVTQTQVRIVSEGFARSSRDYFPGLVASAILGGGFTSRLMEAIRVERGLSYGVRSRFATSGAGGLFFVSTFTKVETTAEIVQVALDETARFCGDGPTAEELERTQSYLSGLYPLSLETHDQLAEKLSDLALFGLSEDEVTGFRERIRAVTTEACRVVARRYLPRERSAIVAVGPAKAIARSLEKFGPVKVVPARKMV